MLYYIILYYIILYYIILYYIILYYTILYYIILYYTTFRNHAAACSVIHTCLLHLLDMDWRENDYVFLKEINLPHVLFTAARS